MNNEKISIKISYAETTPESVEYGDFSKTGWVVEDSYCSFSELVDMLGEYYHPSSFPICEGFLTHTWFTTDPYTVCTGTGTMREQSLHIGNDGISQRALRRALKLLGRI